MFVWKPSFDCKKTFWNRFFEIIQYPVLSKSTVRPIPTSSLAECHPHPVAICSPFSPNLIPKSISLRLDRVTKSSGANYILRKWCYCPTWSGDGSVDRFRIFWYERFCACFVLKFALQRGEGGRECRFPNKAHRIFHTTISCASVQHCSRNKHAFTEQHI